MPSDLMKLAASVGIWTAVVLVISAVAAALATTYVQRDFADIRSALNQEHAEIQRQLGTKVDTETRKAMLADLEHRLGTIDARLRSLDTRVDLLWEDRREHMSRDKQGALDTGRRYIGMEGTNLSGNGSASAIAYMRQRRDQLRKKLYLVKPIRFYGVAKRSKSPRPS